MYKFSRFHFIFLSFLLLIFLRSPLLFAETVAQTGADKQFGFAESLFGQEDYFRAITEYKRFLFLFPEDTRTERAYLRIAESYFRAKRWLEAVSALDEFMQRYPRSSLFDEAVYLKGLSQKNMKNYDQALSTFERLIKEGSPAYRDRAVYQRALIFVEKEDWKRAIESFGAISRKSDLFPSAQIFAQGLGKIDAIPHKDPVIAGSLAAVLPGAGHLYTERPTDAAVAFVLNAAFIWAAYELFDRGEYVTGGVVTFFEIGWYGGNIYSAVSSAHKYNERSKSEFIQKLKESSTLSLHRDRRNPSDCFLMYSFMF